MDNFDYQAYIKSGKIHGEKSTLTEAQATGFGIGQGRSKTISKGKESNPDLKDTLKGKEQKKTKYFMKNGIPHKADGTPLKKMSNENMVADEDIAKEIKKLENENPKGFAKEIKRLKARQAVVDLMKKAKAKGEVKEYKTSDYTDKELLSKVKDNNDLDAAKELYKRDYFDKSDIDKVKAGKGKEVVDDEMHAKISVKEGEVTEEVPSSKMKVSELKAKIKETILSELTLSEADEDVDVDIEDEIEADIEEPTPDSSAIGLSQDEQEIQDNLKLAYDNAVAIGDQKLADQIGNSITFFTRTHVVER